MPCSRGKFFALEAASAAWVGGSASAMGRAYAIPLRSAARAKCSGPWPRRQGAEPSRTARSGDPRALGCSVSNPPLPVGPLASPVAAFLRSGSAPTRRSSGFVSSFTGAVRDWLWWPQGRPKSQPQLLDASAARPGVFPQHPSAGQVRREARVLDAHPPTSGRPRPIRSASRRSCRPRAQSRGAAARVRALAPPFREGAPCALTRSCR